MPSKVTIIRQRTNKHPAQPIHFSSDLRPRFGCLIKKKMTIKSFGLYDHPSI